ncbi:MAG TPA: DUF998 domain-containing protein [Propionibacteriaceae bacterium]|nr:DUF998 domain-containing protein [Propionibacteriaceae bacterium]
MTAVLGIVLLLATVGQFGSLVALHVLPTGLSPMADPVSQYALTRFRAGYAMSAFSAAVAGAAAALILGGLPGGIPAAELLWVFAAARAVIPAFPMDDPAAEPTRRGRLHNLLATVAFAAVTAASFVAAGAMGPADGPGASTATLTAGTVMAIGAVGIVLCRRVVPIRRAFGLAERLIYLGFMAWFLVIAVLALAS